MRRFCGRRQRFEDHQAPLPPAQEAGARRGLVRLLSVAPRVRNRQYTEFFWSEFAMSRYTHNTDLEDFEDWASPAQIRHRWLEHDGSRKPRGPRFHNERPSKTKPPRQREREQPDY